MSKFVDYGERLGLYRSVVFLILMQVVYTHPFIFRVLCYTRCDHEHYIVIIVIHFLWGEGGPSCNKCLCESVMLSSVNTGCEQWCDNLKMI